MELILVRHPETEANRDQIFYTEADYPYTERGQVELTNIVGELRDLDYHVYSSPFRRALHVAQLLSNHVDVDDRLKEMDFGIFKGKSILEVAESDPKAYESIRTRSPGYSFPGGEPYERFVDRVASFFDELTQLGENAIVCTHGGVIDLIVQKFFKLKACYPKTGGVIRLQLDVEEQE